MFKTWTFIENQVFDLSYICRSVSECVWVSVCVYVWSDVCFSLCLCEHVWVCVCLCVCVCVCVCMCVCMCVCDDCLCLAVSVCASVNEPLCVCVCCVQAIKVWSLPPSTLLPSSSPLKTHTRKLSQTFPIKMFEKSQQFFHLFRHGGRRNLNICIYKDITGFFDSVAWRQKQEFKDPTEFISYYT